jgi:hypothetical protein
MFHDQGLHECEVGDITTLTVATARLPILNPLVCTTHFVEDAEQCIKNTDADNGGSPQPDKNGNQLMIYPCAKNKEINGEEYRKGSPDKIEMRLHRVRLIK